MNLEKFVVVLLCVVLGLVCLQVESSPLPEVPAKCNRYQACNGEMCDDICEIGNLFYFFYILISLL